MNKKFLDDDELGPYVIKHDFDNYISPYSCNEVESNVFISDFQDVYKIIKPKNEKKMIMFIQICLLLAGYIDIIILSKSEKVVLRYLLNEFKNLAMLKEEGVYYIYNPKNEKYDPKEYIKTKNHNCGKHIYNESSSNKDKYAVYIVLLLNDNPIYKIGEKFCEINPKNEQYFQQKYKNLQELSYIISQIAKKDIELRLYTTNDPLLLKLVKTRNTTSA